MTTITFGGGPTIEARRNFSNLKQGSQVPGYCGYIHQLKYTNGHTYGDQTHILEQIKPIKEGITSFDDDFLNYKPKFNLKNELPKTNGGNKLTEKMVPGYTGYIPSKKFHFSDTYRAECDQCIDDFITNKNEKFQKNENILNQVKSYNKHIDTGSESELKANLDNYRNRRPNDIYLLSDKRGFTEPPLPGYTGHIPRIVPTELGLGSRYHETTKKGLSEFKNSYLRSSSAFNLTQINNEKSENHNKLGYSVDSKKNVKKIFMDHGMIPKYTGYIHGRKFKFGETYGNTTRNLPVCSHRQTDFGEYLRENPPKTAMC